MATCRCLWWAAKKEESYRSRWYNHRWRWTPFWSRHSFLTHVCRMYWALSTRSSWWDVDFLLENIRRPQNIAALHLRLCNNYTSNDDLWWLAICKIHYLVFFASCCWWVVEEGIRSFESAFNFAFFAGKGSEDDWIWFHTWIFIKFLWFL